MCIKVKAMSRAEKNSHILDDQNRISFIYMCLCLEGLVAMSQDIQKPKVKSNRISGIMIGYFNVIQRQHMNVTE